MLASCVFRATKAFKAEPIVAIVVALVVPVPEVAAGF